MEHQGIIRAANIHKTYDTGRVQVYALRGVDLTVQRAEIVAIMGPSGCGKTTLLNCLAGLDYVDRGEVIIDGVSLARLSDNERTSYRARQMGFVFQFYNLLPVLTAVENVELPLLVSGVRAGEARRRAQEGLAWVGLAGWAGPPSRRTLGRAATAGGDCAGVDQPAGDHLGRRTHGRPGLGNRRRGDDIDEAVER